jgi:hypothetical protein
MNCNKRGKLCGTEAESVLVCGSAWQILMLSFIVPSLAVSSPVEKLAGKEAVLAEFKALIDRNHTNPSNLLKAISILEGYKAWLPNEIRFPMYLAEAY